MTLSFKISQLLLTIVIFHLSIVVPCYGVERTRTQRTNSTQSRNRQHNSTIPLGTNSTTTNLNITTTTTNNLIPDIWYEKDSTNKKSEEHFYDEEIELHNNDGHSHHHHNDDDHGFHKDTNNRDQHRNRINTEPNNIVNRGSNKRYPITTTSTTVYHRPYYRITTTPSTTTTQWIQRYRPSSHRQTTTNIVSTTTTRRGVFVPHTTTAYPTRTVKPTIRTTPTTTTTSSTTTMLPSTEDNELIKKKKKRDVQVLSFCQDPGRPPKSQITPVQLTYIDGEQVTYTCDQFISLKQHRKCVRGRWQGDTPVCGEAFRDNDLQQVLIYHAENGFPTRLISEYNLTNQLKPFNKFGNSFISERYAHPIRAINSSDYYWNLFLTRPALIQMIRISFSVLNYLTDWRIRERANFDVVTVATNQHRECVRVANHSVSPWHYNSTRFDFWYICRAKTESDFRRESTHMTNVVRVETQSKIPLQYDLATFILAEQYSVPGKQIEFDHSHGHPLNETNSLLTTEPHPDPLCGLPEIPVGLESRVINEQSNYVFTCARDYIRVDNQNYEYNAKNPHIREPVINSISSGGQYQMLQCGYDNRWHGQLPNCQPVRTCPKFRLEPDEDDDDLQDEEGHRSEEEILLEVYKYDRVFYFNDTDWIPVKGSRAFFRCKNEHDKFIGKEIRLCDDNGQWTNTMPQCFKTKNAKSANSLKTGTVLLIVFTTLVITFILSSFMIYFFLKLRTQEQEQQMRLKVKKKQQQQQQQQQQKRSLSNSQNRNQNNILSLTDGVNPSYYAGKRNLQGAQPTEENEDDHYEIVDTRRLQMMSNTRFNPSACHQSQSKSFGQNIILGPRVIYTDNIDLATPTPPFRQTRSNSATPLPPTSRVPTNPRVNFYRTSEPDSNSSLARPYLTMTSRCNSPSPSNNKQNNNFR